MNLRCALFFVLGAATTGAAAPWLATPRQEQGQMPPEMAAMFEQAKKYTNPGPKHEKLKDYLGKWNVESTVTFAPGQEAKDRMTAEFSWLIEGRFLKQEMRGTMMGNAYHGFGILGHDNFKQAYVSTWLDSMNTYMLEAQGNYGQDGRTLFTYGTLDEYLTGENDKPVKYAYRWTDADHFTFEVHDLAIGEANTCVFSMKYSRAK